MPSTENIAAAEVFKKEGNGYLTSGDPVRSIKPYTQAISLTPRDHTLFSNRAFAFTKAKKYDRALLDADQAVHLSPLWPKGHFRRGEAFRLAGLHAHALEAYTEASKRDPNDEHLAKCVRDATDSMQTHATFCQRIVYAGAAIGALLAAMLIASGKTGSLLSALVVLALGGPLGMLARLCWEQRREWAVAVPIMSNNDFVLSQFKSLQKGVPAPRFTPPSDAPQLGGSGPPVSGGGSGGAEKEKKGRVKTSTREKAINSVRSRK